MSLVGAFARTSATRAAVMKPGLAADKIKWWAKNKANDGEIIRHLSPHEVHSMGPWLKTFPKKVVDRAPTYIIWPGGSMLLTYLMINYASGVQHAEEVSHRY